MRTTMVIPTYWSRADNHWVEGDAVYDHPTPINGEDTLGRTLESMKMLENKDFKLVIPICPTCREIEGESERLVREIVQKANLNIETYIFTAENLRSIKAVLLDKGLEDPAVEMLDINGYSNVRNVCLYVAHVLASEVVILIDDDEVFENKKFVDMATEFIGKRIYGKGIYGMAGYYLNKYNEFYDDVDMEPWMTYWDRFGSKTKAFDKIIDSEPRIKRTPFAFGGLMVMHKNLFKIIPFDKDVTRGEDIDYLINAKMYGFDFFLDNTLNIKHLPPKKNHPLWKRLREDMYRFLFEQAKIRSQTEVRNMQTVTAEDFSPYPGDFLNEDLEDKIFKTNILLALEYLADGDVKGCRESIKNIYLSKYEAIPKDDPFAAYLNKQKYWVKLTEITSKHRTSLRKIMEVNNLSRSGRRINRNKYENSDIASIVERLTRFEDFSSLKGEELKKLATITKLKIYDEGDLIFKAGEENLEFLMVVSGCIRIANFNDNNEEITLAKVCTNGVVGETSLIKTHYNVCAISNEVTEVLVINASELRKMIDEEDELGKKLLYVFLERLYYKLNKTNIMYKDKMISEENLSEMN